MNYVHGHLGRTCSSSLRPGAAAPRGSAVAHELAG
eukprot:CAMPEP_0204338602 /NCGR_PEP_ID=MMETSP0469-20131031/21184_1 /ASSEMBLY_ACC=CAM_ASM_000384 /TAXON_ID=2969 /ORGANISM="Oxyrrhis marina" /LENGTH=34 /DNA_ID= /DNA_START= /DNA_END= /DNA_ORIENTATION=